MLQENEKAKVKWQLLWLCEMLNVVVETNSFLLQTQLFKIRNKLYHKPAYIYIYIYIYTYMTYDDSCIFESIIIQYSKYCLDQKIYSKDCRELIKEAFGWLMTLAINATY